MTHQPPTPAACHQIVFKYRTPGGQQFPFVISSRYSAGHPLSPGEAQALNQLFAERVRENCRPIFEAATGAAPSGIPGDRELGEVQAKITKYSAGFQFLERHIPAPRAVLSPIDREALELARGAAPDSASEEDIAALAQTDEIIIAATERVRIRAEIARRGLEDL